MGNQFDSIKIGGILSAIEYIGEEEGKELVFKLIDENKDFILKSKENSYFIPILLQYAWNYEHPDFLEIFRFILSNKSKKKEEVCITGLELLLEIIFEQSDDFSFIRDYCLAGEALNYKYLLFLFNEESLVEQIDELIECLSNKEAYDKIKGVYKKQFSSSEK